MNENTVRTGVIDRYEGAWAVVFFDDSPETPVDIERAFLPKRKPKEGTYIKVEMQGEQVLQVSIDKEATAAARKRVQEKLARLRKGDHLNL